MTLASPKSVNALAGGSSQVNAVSSKSRWETVHNNAETQLATPTTIANLTSSDAFWTVVGQGVTRISAIRQAFTGTLSTGATITIIGCDKWDKSTNAPASDAKYRTILSGLALGNTTDITNGTDLFSTQQTNSGSGWDLLGDEAFLVAPTTAASNPTTCTIEAKLTN